MIFQHLKGIDIFFDRYWPAIQHTGEKIAVIFLCFVFYTAYLTPFIAWDSWAYHLPFASYLWNIGGGKNGFVPTIYFQEVYAGYPLFGEWLQGALWVLFNDVRAASLINPLALALLCVTARAWLRIPIFWTLAASLAFPLVVIHVASTYKDLFTGALLATAVVASARLYELLKFDGARPFRRETFLPWAVFSLSLIAASNSKLQCWLVALPYMGFAGLMLMRQVTGRTLKSQLLAYGLLTVILCSYTQIANTVQHGNPFYPFIITGINEIHASPKGGQTMTSYSKDVGIPTYAGNGFFSRPIYFLTSITELDLLIRQVPLRFSIDMTTYSNDYVRSGGFWVPYVFFHCAIIVWWLAKGMWRRLSPAEQFVLYSLGVFTLCFMFMPRSNELRYVMAWPLILVLSSAVCARHFAAWGKCLMQAALLAFFVTGQMLTDHVLFGRDTMPDSQAAWRIVGYQSVVSRLKADGPTCFETQQMRMHLWFRYSAAIIGGSHTITAPRDFDLKCDPANPNRWEE